MDKTEKREDYPGGYPMVYDPATGETKVYPIPVKHHGINVVTTTHAASTVAMAPPDAIYVMEGERPETLVSAVRSVARQETYVGQQTLDLLVDWLADRRSGEGRRKRDRDRDLLRLLAEGRSTSEIAEWMQLAPKTVRNRVSTLYKRLGVHSRAAAVRLAEERGLLDPRDEGRRASKPEDR